jgi:hypothetical protein
VAAPDFFSAISVLTFLSVFIWKCVDPRLYRAEGMLHSLAAQAHLVRVSIEPRLHGLKDGFVLPS